MYTLSSPMSVRGQGSYPQIVCTASDGTCVYRVPSNTRLTTSTLPAGPVGGPQRLAHAKGVPSSTWRKTTNESKTCRTPPSCSSPTEKPPVRTPMTGIFSFAAACASKDPVRCPPVRRRPVTSRPATPSCRDTRRILSVVRGYSPRDMTAQGRLLEPCPRGTGRQARDSR
jgi:hypothetical protein